MSITAAEVDAEHLLRDQAPNKWPITIGSSGQVIDNLRTVAGGVDDYLAGERRLRWRRRNVLSAPIRRDTNLPTARNSAQASPGFVFDPAPGARLMIGA